MAKKTEPDKLAQDAAAALAAGMSYGKWKAMQDPVKIYKPQDLEPGWKLCAWCGKPFKLKTNKKQLYCEAYCQKLAQRHRDKQKNAARSTKEEEKQ